MALLAVLVSAAKQSVRTSAAKHGGSAVLSRPDGVASFAPTPFNTTNRLSMLTQQRSQQSFTPAHGCDASQVRMAAAARRRGAATVTAAAGNGRTEADVHVQLATALLPKDVDVLTFSQRLYQWAATLTSNGQNLPFALPLKVTRTGNGFEISLLRMRERTPVSVADITATVEDVAGKGNVLFVRLFAADGSDLAVGDKQRDPQALVGALSQALVDVPLIMNSMPPAIKLAVLQSRG